MKIVQSPPSWLLWICFCCSVLFANATDDDLLDFDFSDLKEIDWNYETDNSKELLTKGGTTEKNVITFGDDSDLLEENQVHPFDWREKVLRTALSKALMNKAVRQKFVEVMPILRVLTKQQRLALSALITAQINAKKGNELKLEQVRLMFGDDKSLILPIVFDIANLVRNSAKKYIEFDYNLADFGDFLKPKISVERRNLQLPAEEMAKEQINEDVGTLPAAAQITQNFDMEGLEDFMSEEVLDPKEINKELEILKIERKTNSDLDDVSLDGMELQEDEQDYEVAGPLDINIQLQKDVPTLTLLKLDKNQTKPSDKRPVRRLRRSARNSREFVHKLVRSVPLSVNEEDLQRGSLGRTLKLNTTAFVSPKETTIRAAPKPKPTPSTTTTSAKPPIIITPETLTSEESYEPYHLVEDFAFASLNGSEIFLDDTDNDNDENDLTSEGKSEEPDDEILPTPEELIAGPRYRVVGNKLSPVQRKVSRNKRKRIPMRARPKKATHGNGVLPPKKCERFTASMCIKTDDYPM